jgi:hypothetical protein
MKIRQYERGHFNQLYEKHQLEKEFRLFDSCNFTNKDFEHEVASHFHFLDKLNYRSQICNDPDTTLFVSKIDMIIIALMTLIRLQKYSDQIIFTHSKQQTREYIIKLHFAPDTFVNQEAINHLIIDALADEIKHILEEDTILYVYDLIRYIYRFVDENNFSNTINVVCKMDFKKSGVYTGNFDEFLYDT